MRECSTVLMLPQVKSQDTSGDSRKMTTLFAAAANACTSMQCDVLEMNCVPALSTHCFHAAVRFSLVGLDKVATLTL